MNIETTVSIRIPDTDALEIVNKAFSDKGYTGINWGEIKGSIPDNLDEKFRLEISVESGIIYTLTYDKLAIGIRKYKFKFLQKINISSYETGEDAELQFDVHSLSVKDCNEIIQLAIFGKLNYLT